MRQLCCVRKYVGSDLQPNYKLCGLPPTQERKWETPMSESESPSIGTGFGECTSSPVGEGEVNIAAGDFVGRDRAVFVGRDIVSVQGDIHGDLVVYPSTTVGRIGSQIERLRGRITRLIPAEESLNRLASLREPSMIGSRIVGGELTVRTPLPFLGDISTRLFTLPLEKKEVTTTSDDSAEEYLSALSYIEAQLAPEMEPEKLSDLLQRLSAIADEVNIRIARLNSLFVNLVYPATSSKELAENMVSKIGHRELREEAKMHLGVIGQLVEKLDSDQLTSTDIDVLSDEAQAAVGVITELEKRRLIVEKLVQTDRKRRNWTIGVVIAYIGLVIALTTFTGIRWGARFLFGQAPLSELRLPLLGIPWPVIVWSLIGSFAAMIHRFNRRPIHDFGDAVKWMLTRPVQGVVLGSAFYLVLVSGLFLLTGGNATNPSGLIAADEVILVLSFLVGFSDRFADSVFNTLVEKYSKAAESPGEDTTNEG